MNEFINYLAKKKFELMMLLENYEIDLMRVLTNE